MLAPPQATDPTDDQHAIAHLFKSRHVRGASRTRHGRSLDCTQLFVKPRKRAQHRPAREAVLQRALAQQLAGNTLEGSSLLAPTY
eukprot:9027008-Pyramimonas_sp.AAC.1